MPKKYNDDLVLEPEDGQSMEDVVLKTIAARLSPALADTNKMSRLWQWKFYLQDGTKTKFDLYRELAKSPAPLTYDPGPAQLEFHECDCITKQLVGGVRLGKSKALAAEGLPYLFKDNASVGITAFTYEKCQPEFDYIRDWLLWLGAELFPDRHSGPGKWEIGLPWGARLITVSGDDESVYEAYNFDALLVAEAGLMKEKNVARSRTRTLEKGGPTLMSGSLDESEPWYTLKFEEFLHGPTDESNWHAFSAPSWDNRFVFPMGREDDKIKQLEAELPPNMFKLKVCAEIAKREELVFPEFDQRTHVMKFKYSTRHPKDELLLLDSPEPIYDDLGLIQRNWVLPARGPVYLAIDPGYAGAYAVLACRIYGDLIFVIDEVYARRRVVDEVIEECQQKWWWPEVNYAVMDIAGKQRQGMVSHKEVWEQEKYLGFTVKMNYVPVVDGITKLRSFLRTPGSNKPRVFVDPNCQGLLSEFSMYMYRTPEEGRPIREEPIDANNHSIKALEYLLVDRFGLTDRARKGSSESYLQYQAPKKNAFDAYINWALGD